MGAMSAEIRWGAARPRAPGSYRAWQKEVEEHLMVQDDRKICFIVDEKGGAGKSALGRILMTKYKCWYSTGGKFNDLACSYKEPDYKIAIFDLTRNVDRDFHPYSFAEALKNGIFASNKYNSVCKQIIPPKVIWFMNQYPSEDRLSEDRYCVHRLTANTDMRMLEQSVPQNEPDRPDPPIVSTQDLLDMMMNE